MNSGRRGVKMIALEIKDSALRGEPYSLVFTAIPGMSVDGRQALEHRLKENFELWANTWIIPLANEIIAKYEKKDGGAR